MNSRDVEMPSPEIDERPNRLFNAREGSRRSQGAVGQSVENTGHLIRFAGQVIRELPTAVRLYPFEVLRHGGQFVRSNFLVVLFMLFMMGAMTGLTTHYIFQIVGIETYAGAALAVGPMRGIMQVVFGWIIAAKAGCAIATELGAMRISEEIDAMEVMGVRSIPFLIGTRLVAALIVLPALWVIALFVNYGASYLIKPLLLNSVSEGGFTYFHYLFQNGQILFISTIWAVIIGLMIIFVAGYYGYTVKGGPVEVGRNTARSMLVNLVLISLVGMAFVQLFYGNDPNAPIGN